MKCPKWEEALFQTDNGARYGCVWNRWGIHYRRGRRYIVYLIGGRRLTEFDTLRCARRFCEGSERLTDWSRPIFELYADHQLGLAMHRLALNITNSRPDLHIVN